MKSQIPYKYFDTFVLRTPLFPFSLLDKVFSNNDNDLNNIKSICDDPIIKEAIYLASPLLHSELSKLIEDKKSDPKKIQNLVLSLTQYLIRMSSRCTPFGLFAGFCIGNFGSSTCINLNSIHSHTRHTRLDMNYLSALAYSLVTKPEIRNTIKYFPNSTIYEIGDKLRYVEFRYKMAMIFNRLVAVDASDYIKKVKSLAGDNHATIKELAESIVDSDVSYEDAESFVNELINNQFLTPDLEPSITGPEFLDQLLDILKNINGIDDIVSILDEVKDLLKNIDVLQFGSSLPLYDKISEKLTKIGTGFNIQYLFQTDLVINTLNCSLDDTIKKDLLTGIEILNKLTAPYTHSNLSRFIEAFIERFEEREVQLVRAIDPELGIGYIQNENGDINPLVDDLLLDFPNVNSTITWSNVNSYLFNKYKEAISSNKHVIYLEDSELKSFYANWNDLPLTMSVIFRAYKNNDSVNNSINNIFIEHVGGPATNLLGRFCHASNKMDSFVRDIVANEEDLVKDCIFAEIVHLPETRMGNVLLRPVLRNYEIPYLAKSYINTENQIKIDDLFISVRGNKIVLRSKRLNKEIIPRLSSAHNYNLKGLPIHRFLCDLQYQNIRGGFSFDWGPIADKYNFKPRVVYKNIVLYRADWIINTNDIKNIFSLKDELKQFEYFTEFREKSKISEMVYLVDGDNELYLNLKSMLSVKILMSLVKNRPSFRLTESLEDSENSIIKSPSGFHSNQFVASLCKDKAK